MEKLRGGLREKGEQREGISSARGGGRGNSLREEEE